MIRGHQARWPASGRPAPRCSTLPVRTICPAAQARPHPGWSGLVATALGPGCEARRKALARNGKSRWRQRGGSGGPGPSRSRDKGSPAPRRTFWGPDPWEASRTTGCQCVGTQPPVPGIWGRSHCLWPKSDSLQAGARALGTPPPSPVPPTQLGFPDALHVGPACPTVRAPTAKMDASAITEAPGLEPTFLSPRLNGV